ncbi:hypothetical protein PPTG_15225 [Phytophthora nicotianae INRA-310]|uniref:Uncharacterized protein n=1 Tax=Phytophthora nicotianae (strain INRA-310) TaxID=761204 RepID=W2PSI9_PHYN3|nr:hypothetical protein PPTG_15225 [Phytophthora nicotianae INRA-310]ETN03908.1 hypothetical protein PPTG_15225 [Phytophthora nicotianae INRA-310]
MVTEASVPEIHAWADSIMQEWSKQVKLDWKREKRREGMARLRNHRRGELQSMLNERAHLELQYKQQLAHLHRESSESELSQTLRRLILESDILRAEYAQHRMKLQQHKRLHSLTQENLNGFHPEFHDSSNENVYGASEKSQWVSHPYSSETGWRVHFHRGEPSFYFHPFTQDHFDDVIERTVDIFGENPPYIKQVGTLFGWNLHCASPTRREDKSIVSHARFTIRFACSLDEMNMTLVRTKMTALPLLATPPNWNRNQRDQVSIQVLQEFEKDAYVLVCNIPGPVHLRYLYFLRRLTRTLPNGKRKVLYVMIIASSKANERTRLAEDPQDDVEWVSEGGTFLSLTEVDDGTVSFSYDHWTSCKDDHHAQSLFFQWAQFISRWSQSVMPPRLLEC